MTGEVFNNTRKAITSKNNVQTLPKQIQKNIEQFQETNTTFLNPQFVKKKPSNDENTSKIDKIS